MAYIPPVRRVETKRYGKPSHHYVDGAGRKLPGVTTLISDGMPKPALIGWGIKSVAEFAIDHWDELAEMPLSERLKKLKGSPYADRDAAARRGTEVHALAEKLLLGQEVPVPEELAGHVDAYVKFLDQWQPEPVLAESTVYNLEFGWAGTLDLVARFPDGRTLLCDVKTTRSGVFGEVAYQLAAYRYSTHYLDADGAPHPMPEVDGCAVIWVRSDGYDLIPVRADWAVLTEFRHIARVARAAADCKSYVGEALPAPTFIEETL